jgi:AbrB family looped-hinge helix DNA binding protein
MRKRSKKAKLDSHGRITVPLEVRRLLGLRRGASVVFEEKDGVIYLHTERHPCVFEQFRGIGTPGIPRGRKGVLKWTREMRGR